VAEAAGEVDDLQAALGLAQRVGVDLAVLAHDEARELLAVPVEELAEGEHDLRALSERGAAPLARGPRRRTDGAVDERPVGEPDRDDDVAGRRLGDLARPRSGRVVRASVDPVAEGLSSGDRHPCSGPGRCKMSSAV